MVIILNQNKNYFALSKTSGLHSVILANSQGNSVAQWLIDADPKMREVGLKPEDGGLINRLDFETSGVLVAAKNRQAWLEGRKAFSEGKVRKIYTAILDGRFEGKLEIQNYIGTPNRGAKKVKVYKEQPAKRERANLAISIFESQRYDAQLDVSWVSIEIKTGRRHQIRAHAAFIKHTIIGDKLYGSLRSLKEILPQEEREFFLHSAHLSFYDSISKEEFSANDIGVEI
ncbi:MAG: RNA pseudouridine synthase [bacterium]|nr:RNA pseudouridine synthase [bacterium]